VHPSLKFGFHLVQLRLQPFADRLPQHREPSVAPLLHTDMCEAKKVERLRFPFSTPLPLVDRIRTELQQSRFLGMQFQIELSHSFRKFRPKLIGIRFVPESNHDVVCESHHDHITVCTLLTPCLDPQVEYVMKIDVRQKRRSTSTLGRPCLHTYSFLILQHAGSITRTGTSQLASATVRLTTNLGPVTIHDVRVLKNKSGVAWVALPSFSIQQSATARLYEYKPTIELSPELFEQISTEVLRTYRTSQNRTENELQGASPSVQHPRS